MGTEKYDDYELLSPERDNDNGTIFPIAFSLTKYDWSNLEKESGKTVNRLILAVGRHIQDVIKEMIKNKKKRLNQLPVELIRSRIKDLAKDESMPNSFDIKIPLKDFNVAPHYYSALREILKLVYQVGVKFPERRDNGIDYITYKSLCYCSFPLKGRKDHVIVHFDKDVINALVNLEFGYQRINPSIEIVVTSKDVSSISYRIYSLLNAYDYKHRYDVNINDFREIIGVKRNSYLKTWQFKQKVLEPAKIRLKELSDRGVIDLYFDYEIYDKNSEEQMVCLLPKHGKFYNTFHHQVENKAKAPKRKLTTSQNKFYDILNQDFPFLSQENMERYSRLICDKNIQVIERLEIKLKTAFDSNEKAIKNKKNYVLKCLDTIFQQVEKSNEVEKKPALDYNREKWSMCLANICRGQSQQDIDDVYSRFFFNNYLRNYTYSPSDDDEFKKSNGKDVLILNVKSAHKNDNRDARKEIVKAFESRERYVMPVIQKYFGKNVQIKYII